MWCCSTSNIDYEEFDTISEPDGRPLKITAVGDGMVGKTSLLITYTQNEFPLEYEPTVFDNHDCCHTVDGINYNLMLWDTAGQEEFDRLRPLSYPKTQCYLVFYSINSRTSYENVLLKWSPEIRHFSPNVPFILVGTKSDLRTSNSEDFLTNLEGRKLMNQIRAYGFVECSAKNGVNVENVFEEAIRAVKKKKPLKTNVCRIL